MAMTRSQMVTEICDVVGKSAAAASVSGALLQDRVVTYLNWGQKRMARVYSFNELNDTKENAVTVAGVKAYPLFTGDNAFSLTRLKDIHSIRLIDDENSRTLTRWSYRRFDKRFPRPENFTTGRPSIYVRWANKIELFRIPDSAYTLYIRFSQWANDMSSDTQVSDFLNKDQLLVTAGILETYLALEEYTDAKSYYQLFLGQMNDAIKAEGDVDWEPEAEAFGGSGNIESGQPWLDPYGSAGDPLYGYTE